MKKNYIQLSVLLIAFLLVVTGAKGQLFYEAANVQNKAGTWTDLGSNGSALSMSSYDDENSSSVSIGFNFDFNGTTYTDFVVNTNGFLKFGTSAPSSAALFMTYDTSTYGGVLGSTSSEDTAILSIFNHDLESGASNSPEIRVYTSGSSGSQVCTIQWKGFRDKNSTNQFDEISFQIKLYEGSNLIEFIYGSFTASGNASAFKTVGVGIKAGSPADSNVIVGTKESAQGWFVTTFRKGNLIPGTNAHNVRNSVLPDSGRTYRFIPTYAEDIGITNIYSYGKMPIPFATPDTLEMRIANTGMDDMSNFWVYLTISGANSHSDSMEITATLKSGESLNIKFLTPAKGNTGQDTINVWVNDDNKLNDGMWAVDVNLNSYSYVDITQSISGGIGFNGVTGDFVAKFSSNQPSKINQIKVNFTTSNVNYRVGIWEYDTITGEPGANIWLSSLNTTSSAQAVISVNPPVDVQGSFFVGVQQDGNINVGFAFQYETPIRDSVFYYTAPKNNTAWTDFATLDTTNFRFMIEPRLMISDDAGIVKLVSPNKDTCLGGKMMSMEMQLQNLGSDTIFFSTDSVAVYGIAVDPNGDTTAYGPKWVNSGYLSSNDTLNVEVTDQFDMTLLGDYYITGYSVHALDLNLQNDTLPWEKRTATGANADIYSLNNGSKCNGDSVFLSAGNSVNGIQFQWNYYGNAINNATDSTYYATAAGEYTCTVINGYGCPAFSDTIVVSYLNTPVPTFQYANPGYCPGDSLYIIGSTNATTYTYEWQLNGTTITGKSDSDIYVNAAGTYTLKVTDPNTGCTGSDDIVISAYSSPDTTVTITGNTIICQGDSVELSATAAAGLTYQWYDGITAISGATAYNYFAKTSGSFSVKVYNTSTGCSASNLGVYIQVDSLPDATFTTHTGLYGFCDLDSLQLIANNTGSGLTYQWNDMGGPIGGASNATYTIFIGGDYSLTVTNANGCSNTGAAVTINVYSTPMPQIDNPANTSFCEGDSILLNTTGMPPGHTYQWMLNGSNLAGQTDTFIYCKLGGDYSVKASIGGCSGESGSVNLVRLDGPNPVAVSKNNTTICQGDSLELEVTGSSSVASIQWRFNGTDITGGVGTNIWINQAGNYDALLTGTNGCSGISNKIAVTVNNLPTASITYSKPMLSANTGAGLTYQWYKDGTPIAGATSATYSATSNGEYYVEITDGNGCTGSSNKINITDIGFGMNSVSQYFRVSPNPSTGLYNISWNNSDVGQANLQITDITGKVIFTETVKLGYGNINQSIDLSAYSTGIYILNISLNNQQHSVRLIKQ